LTLKCVLPAGMWGASEVVVTLQTSRPVTGGLAGTCWNGWTAGEVRPPWRRLPEPSTGRSGTCSTDSRASEQWPCAWTRRTWAAQERPSGW